MTPQPKLRLIVLIGLLALVGGIVLSCGGLENQPLEPVEAKQVKKAEQLKNVQFKKGKFAPKQIKQNNTHILIIGGYCTCSKHR